MVILLYKISGTSFEKKTRPRVQVKDIKLRILRTYSYDLNKGIFAVVCKPKQLKTLSPEHQNFMSLKAAKTVLLDWVTVKIFVLYHSIFLR